MDHLHTWFCFTEYNYYNLGAESGGRVYDVAKSHTKSVPVIPVVSVLRHHRHKTATSQASSSFLSLGAQQSVTSLV